MSNFFYTAIVQPSTGKIQYAEHFVEQIERDKRSKQLESEARRMSPFSEDGKPHHDAWLCYSGDEPAEAHLERQKVEPKEGEDPSDYANRCDVAASKAKTTSVLTDPEIDDSQEARPLPAWAVAQAEMEKAYQLMLDAKKGTEALQKRADNMAEAAYSRASDGPTKGPGELAEARRKAVDAQAEADHEKARLYHAEQDYLAKLEEFKKLFKDEQDASAARANVAKKK